MKKMIFNVIALCVFINIPLVVNAQRSGFQQTESPVVHPDNTVTFSFKAPEAKKVELSAQFIKGHQALNRDTSGIWSITLGPV